MLERIYFETEDQIELVGLLEKTNSSNNKVVISIHGMQSNCLKRRETILSNKILDAGIAYFTFNNRGSELMTYTRKITGEKILNGGSVYEDVLDGYYDIKAAITKMKELGYTEIYLQGHSLGCTKIVYTYNKLKEERNIDYIKGIILLSLVDIPGCQKYNLGNKYNEYLKFAEDKQKSGQDKTFMPVESFDHPISVKSYLRYFKYNEQIDFAKYSNKDYNYEELNKIQIPLFLRWGNVYELVIQDLNELIKLLKNKLHNSKLDIDYIDGADHGYTGKEEVLAEQIIKFIKSI